MDDSISVSSGFRASPQQNAIVGADPRSVVQCVCELEDGVDPAALKPALEALVARHEILRTNLVQPVGMLVPQQVVADAPRLEWAERRCSASPSADELLADEAERGFDLAQDAPLRALLAGRGDRAPLLVLSAPAACMDRESLLLALGELAGRHRAEPLDEEPIQFADYAEWRHELTEGDRDDATEGAQFWRGQLEAAATDGLSTWPGSPGPDESSGGDERLVPIELGPELVGALGRVAGELGVPVAVVAEAAWHALLARLSGTDAVLVAGWCDGRAQPDLAGAIGPYAQPVPIRSAVHATTSFAELVDQVRRARLLAARHQDHARAEDLKTLARLAGAGFLAVELPALAGPGCTLLRVSGSPAPAPLLLEVAATEGRVDAQLSCDRELASRASLKTIGHRFELLLTAALGNPQAPVAELPITDEHERRRLLAQSAGPAPATDSITPVHLLLERNAQRAGDASAVSDSHRELSYRELNAGANRLARLLGDIGVGPGDVVGICMERTVALIEALFGILKSGAGYLPLNPEYPHARLEHQLSTARARVLVTEAHLVEHFPGFDGRIVCVDRDRELLAACADADLGIAAGPEDLAYLMYTSGSTGQPKGVRVTHRNLANYASGLVERLGAKIDGMGFGVVSSISTDLGNTSIFPPLIAGGRVRLISPEACMSAPAFADELAGRALDVLKITPSHLRALLADTQASRVLPAQWLILGGEALPWDLVREIRALSPTCRLLNHYGPTEATIGCCSYEVGPLRDDARTVPIGFPLPGARAYVLDSASQPLPTLGAGELCIAGAGVAEGYASESGDEADRFVADPFADGPMYRTGDRARRLPDGAIEFLGRFDDQVKIRGHRIEPGEIEAALTRHPSVRHAAVTLEDDRRGDPVLVAYLVAEHQLTFAELRGHLAASLPEQMIPSAFATLDALPFTPSGKIDRRALAGRAEMLSRQAAQYVAPSSPLETDLVAIWTELLGAERVGVNDDFFALGGHSLLAARVVARVRSELAIELPLHSLFAHPTIASLSSEILRMMGASDDETERLMAELEDLSDEEAKRLLVDER